MFTIEDSVHAEPQEGSYATIGEAVAELQRLAALPWNEPPNVAPCTNWENCGRNYTIVEYDVSTRPWKELQRLPALNVSASGVQWLIDPNAQYSEASA
jgi:hypothetical protein